MTTKPPFFSIIIPTYNRPLSLERCLQALIALEFERNRFEVIIVDDGGKIPLDPILVPVQEDLNLTLIGKPMRDPLELVIREQLMLRDSF